MKYINSTDMDICKINNHFQDAVNRHDKAKIYSMAIKDPAILLYHQGDKTNLRVIIEQQNLCALESCYRATYDAGRLDIWHYNMLEENINWLHFAVILNLPNSARFLSRHFPEYLSDENNNYSISPASLALAKEDLEMTRILYESASFHNIEDVFNQKIRGVTPLRFFIERYNPEMVEFVIKNLDVDLDAKEEQLTHLTRAVHIFSYAGEEISKYNYTYNIPFENSRKIIKILVDSGADVNVEVLAGFTIICYDAITQDSELFGLIFQKASPQCMASMFNYVKFSLDSADLTQEVKDQELESLASLLSMFYEKFNLVIPLEELAEMHQYLFLSGQNTAEY